MDAGSPICVSVAYIFLNIIYIRQCLACYWSGGGVLSFITRVNRVKEGRVSGPVSGHPGADDGAVKSADLQS